ncbi:MarR family winged helix-turn-helix transcriptional regulator [Rhizobium sp. ZK1]|uniref:MarR family winged helix-turn-helix transcriptional regulator n=1 Tax=Rhizobium sp. ZK1 TaxID=3389872 RepID=UPI0039F6F08F
MPVKTTDRPVPLDDQLCYAVYSASIAIQRLYKTLLDDLGLTYPQYLALNVLWRSDNRSVGEIADTLALESSTMTPVLKRLEVAELIKRTRNPANERQVVVALTDKGRALASRARCLGDTLLTASAQTPAQLATLNEHVRHLRDALYTHMGDRKTPL